MNPNHLAKLGAVVLVIAAAAIVVRFKEADSSSAAGDSSGAIGSMVLADQPGATSPAPQDDDTEVTEGPALKRRSEQPHADAALPRLLDLGADRCIPCKKMAPILEALREDFAGQFDVVFIDVWKNKQAAVPYRIKLIPTQIFFDEDGKELLRHEGFFSREDILETWAKLGFSFGTNTAGAGGPDLAEGSWSPD
jgi:thioredoxin 1